MAETNKEMRMEELDIDARQYQKLFYKSPAGMLLLDQDGNILKANQAILETTGYRFEEVIGKSIFDLFVEEDI